jgi:DNA mismatch endonuclease (patch repair protein)
MADGFSKQKRSDVMSRMRGRGNKDTELALAVLLRAHRITGWRRQFEIRGRARSPLRAVVSKPKTGAHGVTRPTKDRTSQCDVPTVRVKPDFVFPKIKLAVFVDGCFWHGCPKHATWPANRAAWWRRKFEGNQARDALVTRTLRSANWRVLRVWEHDLHRATRDAKHEARLMRRLSAAISG